MSVDPARLGELVARVMDELEQDFPEHTQPTLTDALLVVEVAFTDGDDDRCSSIGSWTLSQRNVVGVGLASRSLHHFLHGDATDDPTDT